MVIIRAFLKPGKGSAEALEELARKAKDNAERISEESDFSVLLLVPTDYDFGGSARAIDFAIAGMPNVFVLGAPGHHSSGVLNAAVDFAYEKGATHIVFLSGKAGGYFTRRTAERISRRLAIGDKAVGVLIKELDGVQPVPFQNTFAAYEIDALRSAGGFTSLDGVEEMSVLVAFARRGWDISILVPDEGAKLQIREHGGAAERHAEVKDTKVERQLAALAAAGTTAKALNARITLL
jgi:hypothetical protein